MTNFSGFPSESLDFNVFNRVSLLFRKLVRLVFSVVRLGPWRLVQLVSQVSFLKVCKFGVFLACFLCYSDLVATCTTSFSSHNMLLLALALVLKSLDHVVGSRSLATSFLSLAHCS